MATVTELEPLALLDSLTDSGLQATEPEDAVNWFLDRASARGRVTPEEEALLGYQVVRARRALEGLAAATGLPEDLILRYLKGRVTGESLPPEVEAPVRQALSGLERRGRRLLEEALEGVRAWARLVEANLLLAAHFAQSLGGEGLSPEDLLQEANLGLMTAAWRFDPARGTRFSTYAYHWIRQALSRASANTGRAIRLPHHKVDALKRIRAARARLEQALGRPPTHEEVARELGEGWTEKLVAELASLDETPLSLDTPVGEEKDGFLGDLLAASTISPEEEALARWERARVAEALARLPKRVAKAVSLRYGLDDGVPRLLDEVGRVLGVSRERARQLVERGLSLLERELAHLG
ncbi:sigma-70 family RNA polymerase sigma factor [Fervidobacterium sp.]